MIYYIIDIRYCKTCKYDVILSNTRPPEMRSRVTIKPYFEIKIPELQVLQTLQQKKLFPVFARITGGNLRGSTSEDFRDSKIFCASKVDFRHRRRKIASSRGGC